MGILTDKFLVLENDLRNRMKKVRKSTSAKALHDLRVSYKQMDAFQLWCLTFMSPVDANVFVSWLRKLRPLYKITGKLRTDQLMFKIGSKNGLWRHGDQLEGMLHRRLERHEDEFIVFIRKFRFPSSLRLIEMFKHYECLSKQRLVGCRDDLVARHIRESHAALSSPSGQHWHVARRLLKSNVYLTRSDKHLSKRLFSMRLVEEWSDMEGVLGKWHDWVVLRDFMLDKMELSRENQLIIELHIRELETQVADKMQKAVPY
ncbi:MAG: CHAD domain-containing protein [Breznakibacter sp.]